MQREPLIQGYYDVFSHEYERERGRGYHQLVDTLETEIVAERAGGGRVLEVGCGTGLILEGLAAHGAHVAGVDLSPGMVQRARARGLPVLLGSVTRLPFAPDSFDVTCSFKVLAHVPEVRQALREMARVTRPQGHVIAEFYNPWSLRYVAKRLAGPRHVSAGTTEADVYTRWDSPSTVRRHVPEELSLEGFLGVRVLTPAAFAHRIPGVRTVLSRAERACVDSPLRYAGGFLIAVLRKHAPSRG